MITVQYILLHITADILITDGDKFEFVKTLFQRSYFVLLQELYESGELLTFGKHCDFRRI